MNNGMINIVLPDGSMKQISEGSSSLDLAKSISHGLAKKVIAAMVNGQLRDLQDPLWDGDSVVLLDSTHPCSADLINHSCEHILAAAVIELFPHAQVTMGPKNHENGFYYDFDIGRPFSEQDLVHIEKKMASLISAPIQFTKKMVNKNEALEIFKSLGQTYKKEILDWIEQDEVSIYQSAHFVDLCRGPHLPSSTFIKAFKLLSSSGSYWRGDSSKEMLQRINGVAFSSKALLDEYIFKMEEAKKRDHRKLGPKHDLFFVSERFDSWQDPTLSFSEAKIILNVPKGQENKTSNLVAKLESLLESVKSVIPSKELKLGGINIGVTNDEEASADMRIFMQKTDASSASLVMQKVSEFNKNNQNVLNVKIHVDVYAQEDIGPGLVMWLPSGGRLRSIIEDFSRKRHFDAGYEMVYSPHIAKSDLWRISGHLGFYKDSMFAPMNVDGHEYLLKPMNCPFHVLMYKHRPRSYKELPLRFAEFGTVYRYELAGVLHGLMRVRGFTQDDAHLFCRWDQLDEELNSVLIFIKSMLSAFGFTDFVVNVSTRPEKYVGLEKDWDRAEESLKNAATKCGFDYTLDEGGGAFYGPKIDIKLKDCLDRMWQCSTVQLDFNNPERFNLEFINNKGEKERPVMLHRALLGSIERFIGVLIEHYAGAFPAWIAPEQVRVLSVSDKHNEHAKKLESLLKERKIRASFKIENEKLGAKIRQAQIDKVPFMIVVGDEEVENDGGTLRLRSQENKGFLKTNELLELICDQCKVP